MARSHKPKKSVARREPDPKLLADNDARIAEAKALASTEAPARNNDGTFAKKNSVVMPEPPLVDKSLAVPLFIELVLFVAYWCWGMPSTATSRRCHDHNPPTTTLTGAFPRAGFFIPMIYSPTSYLVRTTFSSV